MPLFEDAMPTSFDQIVGQDRSISEIQTMLARVKKTGEVCPHIHLYGPPGSGKTATAHLIAQALFGEGWRSNFVGLNASDDRGIGVVRDKIKPLSQVRNRRIIFLDEADQLTEEAQDALRAIMQPDHKITTTFILATNKPWRLTDAIRSRCVEFSFRALSPDEMTRVIVSVFTAKGIQIKDNSPEEIRQVKDGINTLVKESHGNMRKALSIVEKIISENKTISSKEVVSHQKQEVAVQALKVAVGGDFDKARELIEDSFILDGYNPDVIIEDLYEAIKSEINDRELRAFLFTRLSETEDRCRRGGTPVLHLVAFMAYSFIAPQVDRKALMMNR